ncbi:hypothetical protein BVRB_3g054760 [Beta vulgaris subsp. vulgaris]|nr:hypothetical protein BVRB_3g054760 [Beta vulgaris subsp. vulgaris]
MELYGNDAFHYGQVDEWLDYIPIFYQASEFEAACSYADAFLSTSSFLVGFDFSIADIALWSALSGTSQRWESLRRSKKYKNLVCWYNSLTYEYSSSLNEVLGMAVGKIKLRAGIPTDLNSNNFSKIHANGDIIEKTKTPSSSLPEIDLPNAEFGKVCLRFAPEPNGFLHIGDSKAALLNKYFADKYEGRLIIRLDDTNPAKESNEFVQSLLKDIDSLGLVYEVITYTSDYFPQLMEMAEKLIREGKAYADDTPVEQMRTERDAGVESKCRNNTIGSQYKVYPTYDFASPFVDALEGITHALRSNEYCDRDAQYHLIQKDMGVRQVHFYEFSRLNMVYTLLSKRKLLWFVQNGRVEGWDDPRLPTVQGMVRRGLKIEALAQFIREQGASTNQNLMEWDKLWSINKRIIDPICPRHTAVFEDRHIMISLIDGPVEPFVRILPRHKKFKDAGDKCIYYTKNIWIDYVDALSISANDELKLTWLPEMDELVRLQLVEFDYLITKEKLVKSNKKKGKEEKMQEEEDFLKTLNPVTRKDTLALGDSNMRNLKSGDIIQLERKGYFRCDVPYLRHSKPMVLFAIPDGRQRNVVQ